MFTVRIENIKWGKGGGGFDFQCPSSKIKIGILIQIFKFHFQLDTRKKN